MKIMEIIGGLLQYVLFRLFPFMTYKGVIRKQINIYKSIKGKYPSMSENDVLNNLIASRMNSWPRMKNRDLEYMHYKSVIEDEKKTLAEVILEIIDFEYIFSREENVKKRLAKMGIKGSEAIDQIEEFRDRMAWDIMEEIEKDANLKGRKGLVPR